jgi:hypothetical protein
MSIEKASNSAARTVRPDDVDTSSLIGAWRNTCSSSTQIASVHVETESGRLMLSVCGAGKPSLIDWGSVPIGRVYRGSPTVPQVAAFEAQFDFGSMTALLESNISKGLLIIACLKTFRDGSGRSNYFVREFFARLDESRPTKSVRIQPGEKTITCAGDEPSRGLDRSHSPRLDAALFVGRWANTDSATRGLREVLIRDRDGGLVFEIEFADGEGDGSRCETVAELFAETAGAAVGTQFHAVLERSGQTLRMHGWVKLGVLVIAIFRRPIASAVSPSWFDREFFSQTDPIA